MLSPRTGTILRSIVGQYIVRATPVASQNVTEACELGVCPATIRNEMARLEEEGYISRPYPSAGSKPMDKGYRYYVDSITDIELPLAEQRLINHLFYQVEMEFEKWLSLSATIIAKLAQNMAIVTKPKPVNSQFKHVELVTLEDSLALMVLVLHGARVKQQLVTFDRIMTQSELSAIAGKLNAAYAGLTRSQVLAKDGGLSPTEQALTNRLLEIMQAEDKQKHDEPYLDGWHFMLNQPEFTQNHQVLALMELAEQRNLLNIITPPGLSSHGLWVSIGKENKSEIIHEYSVVLGQFGLPGEAVGTIAVVGPTRMPYARTISTISYLSSVLSTLVAELYGREKSTRPTSHDVHC